jgi:hypothetical protein
MEKLNLPRVITLIVRCIDRERCAHRGDWKKRDRMWVYKSYLNLLKDSD